MNVQIIQTELWSHWQFMALSHSSAVLGLAAEESRTGAAFFPINSCSWTAAWSGDIERIRNASVSLFPKSENVPAEIRSAKLSWAAPVVHPDCPPHSFGTAGTGHPGKATPLTSLTRDGLNLLKLLQAEGTLIQSTLKWKHPLKWCYWQCYNIFRIFQTRSVYPITADPAFYFFSQCMSANINLFLLTWYKGNNRTITAALLLMNTNLITPLFFPIVY